MLDASHDAGTQLAKLAEATNELFNLHQQFRLVGNALSEAEVELLKATDKLQAKINRQMCKGKYKEIGERIKLQKEIISSIKYLIKAEGSQF